MVEWISEDVLDAALHKQVLPKQTSDSWTGIRPGILRVDERRNRCRYLLNPQAEVEDAVWAVRLPTRPPDFADEAS